MILNSLKLTNFKGIKDFEFKPNGVSVYIFGNNATGKSTLYDAYLWLLFGKNSLQQKNFGIKPNGLDMRNESVVVIGEFDDPKVTLERRYAEKWVKERGSPEESFAGHTSTYLVNGVVVKESDYNNTVAKLGSEEAFKMFSNPIYFATLKHEERRNIVLGLVDVAFESEHDISIINQNLKTIEQEIKDIPTRIKELYTQVKDLPDGEENLKTKLDNLKLEQSKLLNQKYQIQNNTNVITQLNEINRKINEITTQYNQQAKCYRDQNDKDMHDLRVDLDAQDLIKNQLTKKISTDTNEILIFEKEIERLREEYKSVNEQKCDEFNSCPTCKQTIPTDIIQKAISEHNISKSNKLSEIQQLGKQKKSVLLDKKSNLEKLNKELDVCNEKINTLNTKIQKLKNESSMLTLDSFETYKALLAKKELLENQENINDDLSKLDSELSQLDLDIKNILYYLAVADTNRSLIERINQLKEHQQSLGAKYNSYNQQKFEYTTAFRKYLENITGQINAKFENVRFKLFDEQINGEIKDVCIMTYKGVDYNDLNNAAKINCGLDIINALIKHYNKAFPVWIDNAESITEIWKPEAQTICLVVDAKYNQLKII